MSRGRFFALPAVLLAGGLCLLSGCGDSLSADALAAQQKFVLQQKPSGEQSVKDIRKALETESGDMDVVLIGRIDGGQMPAFEEGKAAFMFADSTGHGGTDHDPFACKFCSKNPENYAASVRFQIDGKVVATDTRQLFNVAERQKVMITGKASIDDSDTLRLLNVDATGIYVMTDD